ncbi:MAG: SMP-30/gluconolactonase/LRE family protein [Casimicrobiaceae bacterium]
MINTDPVASPFACALDIGAALGESPVWSVDEQVLYFVDIRAPSLNRFDPAGGRNVVMPMPSSIGCFALRQRGGFIVALRDGIWLADRNGALERKVADAPYDVAHHRFNDGRCDLQGRFFAGSINENRDAESAQLVRIDIDFRMTQVLCGMTISNGLAWSPDGRTMYHADTPTRSIRAFDYDSASGTPSNPRTFASFAGATERPDGGAVDSAGNYWTAFFHGGKVVKLSPRGEILDALPVPAMCPTMCAFGGPELRTLYVTSARGGRPADELARLPQSGGVFTLEVDTPGRPEPRFAG